MLGFMYVVLACCFNTLLPGQDTLPENNTGDAIHDSVFQQHVKDSTNFLMNDSIFSSQTKDSIYDGTEQFYDSLKQKLNNKKITRQLGNILFTKEKKISGKKNEFVNSENKYRPYKGKIIRKIHIRRLPVFPEIKDDSVSSLKDKLTKFGNTLHVSTRKRIIRNNLFIETGEKINPYELAGNERILRQLAYINDANFIILPVNDSDSVDVYAVTRDLFSIGIVANPSSLYKHSVDIYDKNVFGTGHQLNNRMLFNFKSDQPVGYRGNYIVDNIAGSFLRFNVEYLNAYQKEAKKLQLQRKKIFPHFDYYGGMTVGKFRETNTEYINGAKTEINVNYDYQDVWLTRRFSYDKFGRRGVIFSNRVFRYAYNNRPQQFLNRKYQNHTFWLSSIGLSEIRYFKGRNIFGYGKPEDIPYGYMFEMFGGIDFVNGNNIPYIGAKFGKGIVTDKSGVVFGNINAGGFWKNDGVSEGVIDFQLLYISPLYFLKRFKLRQFLSIESTMGFNQVKYDSIHVNDSFIRGMNSDHVYGKNRMAVNIETICFTPWYLYGFEFALYTFADIGFIGKDVNFLHNRFYSGIGVGLRVGNEYLAFGGLQLRLAYYPNHPPDMGILQSNISQSRIMRRAPHNLLKPTKIPYK